MICVAKVENPQGSVTQESEVPSYCFYNQKHMEDLDVKLGKMESKFEKRLSKLEERSDDRDQQLLERILEMDKQYALIISANSQALEAHSATMQKIEGTLIEMTHELSNVVQRVSDMNHNMSHINDRVGGVEKQLACDEQSLNARLDKIGNKVCEVDEKSKIDVVETMRDQTRTKLAPYLVGGGVAAGIVALFKILENFFG